MTLLHQKIVELALSLAISGTPVVGTTTPPQAPEVGFPKPAVIKTIEPLKQPDLQEIAPLAPIEPPPPARPVVDSAGNWYTPGNCTWYAKSRRPDLPNNLGNANTWTYMASIQGFSTGSTPRAGAIGQLGMHVVYIESVSGDYMTLSEMNYLGLYQTDTRTVLWFGWQFIY